ncbi:hypothetical protein D3C79_797550 [compost metagenome]
MPWAGIVRPVHDDGTLAGIAVLARAQAIEAQRIAVLALIGLGGAIDPEGALSGVELIGELAGGQLPRISAVADPGVIEQLVAFDVDDEQPALGRGFAVVDDGQNGFSLVLHPLIPLQSLAKYLLVELARQPELAVEILIPAGVADAAETERPQQQGQAQPEPTQSGNPVCVLHP